MEELNIEQRIKLQKELYKIFKYSEHNKGWYCIVVCKIDEIYVEWYNEKDRFRLTLTQLQQAKQLIEKVLRASNGK